MYCNWLLFEYVKMNPYALTWRLMKLVSEILIVGHVTGAIENQAAAALTGTIENQTAALFCVTQCSSLDSAGLHVNDVIVQCDGKTVYSFLEFSEMVWDKKVGDVLQLAVVRVCENEPIRVDMVVNEVGVRNFNRWPRNWSY